MVGEILKMYSRLLGIVVALAAVGMISAVSVERAANTAGQSVRTGLISLKALNAHLGF